MNLPHACTPSGYALRDVQLEMSLKPFWDNTPEMCEAVCRELFIQWYPLCRHAESISIMLWVGDGSEILEYSGEMEVEFEWGSFLGGANPIHTAPEDASRFGNDPERRGVHSRPYAYRPEPAKFTLRWLKDLVSTLKSIGTEITGKKILVGETFDIGPEFAVSRFKYDWHREICGGGGLFGGKFIRCDVNLKKDTYGYASFPSGIPEGTSIGTFFGRQTQRFLSDLDFDFIWFSNGFGFALEPWALTGVVFDGAKFKTEEIDKTYQNIMTFWREFRAEAPHFPIRTRGTNLCTGIDLGSDASPLRDIYREIPGVDAPVNSPWAALDADIGLEMAGWMSHIARLPASAEGYRYRYYIHDPWWLNSPYLDRYQRQPFDIYIPLAVSRLQKDGSVQPPIDIAFLSVDDTKGQIPLVVPTEVIPHILHAREFLPDAPAPFIWAYPFDAYHDLLTGPQKNPGLPFFGDWFVRGMITHTVPMNTVADTADLIPLIDSQPEKVVDSVLISPVIPERFGITERFLAHAQAGGKVLLYGPLCESKKLAELFGITCEQALEGDFTLEGTEALQLCSLQPDGHRVRHLSVLSAGGWSETSKSSSAAVLVHGEQEGLRRAACALHQFPSGGQIAWVRGSLSTAEYDPVKLNKILGPRLSEHSANSFLPTEKLARAMVEKLGWKAVVGVLQASTKEEELDEEQQRINRAAGILVLPQEMDPFLCIHRNKNAFVYSCYQPSVTTELKFGSPWGAPLFIGLQNRVEKCSTLFSCHPFSQQLCRIFATQEAASVITCKIEPPIQFGYTWRLRLSGLCNATLRFFPEPDTAERLEILSKPQFPYFHGDFIKPKIFEEGSGIQVLIENVSGELLISW